MRGFDVLATMRDPSAGESLRAEAEGAAGRLEVERLDVTEPEALRVPDGLRVLVNNAGLDREYLPVEHTPLSQWRAMFETNLFGVVEITRLAIPALRRGGGGVVCNVTTCSTLVGVPLFSVYRASKAAVSAFGESLQTEVAPFGIRVLEVMPGPIDTDMLAASDRLPEGARHEGYLAPAENLLRGRRAVAHLTASPAAAAERIVDAILDDDAPLRVACDPLGEAQLGAWRAGRA